MQYNGYSIMVSGLLGLFLLVWVVGKGADGKWELFIYHRVLF